MKESRLQLRLAEELKKKATGVARRRHTTLSALVTIFLQQMVEADLVQRRTGNGEVDQV